MPSPSFCRLCQCPLEVESATGLCETCLRTADTTLANPRPSPNPGAFPVPLSSDAPVSGATAPQRTEWIDPPTGSFVPAPETRTHRQAYRLSTPARLPDAPPGYDLLSRLGGGGMGDVFLARAHFANRLVAMKFLRFAGNSAALDRFVLELRALAALDHPNIIRVLSDDMLRAEPYFTTEFAAGGTLGQWVEAHGPLDPREAARLMATVARAVAAAHKRSILHRDLKPSNILLAMPGESTSEVSAKPTTLAGLVPKVADFGLAKRMDQEGMTVGSSPLGTANYMPPEQISKKNGEVGPASDVYGLGSTLYQLLTGKPPFGSGDAAEIMYRVLSDAIPRPRAVRPDVPPDLDGIVVKCLEKETTRRYQSAAALAEDLEAFVDGRNVVAPRQTFVRRVQRWTRRHRVRLATASLVVVALVAMGFYFARPVPKTDPPDPWAELERDLAGDKPTILVPEKGPPRAHEWITGAATLAPSNIWREPMSFQSSTYSVLMLARDPKWDNYRFEVELCHEHAVVENSALLGIFVNYQRLEGVNGESIHKFQGAEFSDSWTAAEKIDPMIAEDHSLALFKTMMYQNQVGDMNMVDTGEMRRFPFLPAPEKNLWRGFAAEVSPDGVFFFWRNDPKSEWVPAFHLTRHDLDEMQRADQRSVNKQFPNARIEIGPWSPRRPLGIYSRTSIVSFRNAVIIPRTPEKAP